MRRRLAWLRRHDRAVTDNVQELKNNPLVIDGAIVTLDFAVPTGKSTDQAANTGDWMCTNVSDDDCTAICCSVLTRPVPKLEFCAPRCLFPLQQCSHRGCWASIRRWDCHFGGAAVHDRSGPASTPQRGCVASRHSTIRIYNRCTLLAGLCLVYPAVVLTVPRWWMPSDPCEAFGRHVCSRLAAFPR